jgi:predicted Fe-Mo cluster-binding NifX family protein
VADLGVEAVITGNLGPKAYTVLEAVGIRMVTGVSGTVRQAVQRFIAGELTEAGGPNVEGHWV